MYVQNLYLVMWYYDVFFISHLCGKGPKLCLSDWIVGFVSAVTLNSQPKMAPSPDKTIVPKAPDKRDGITNSDNLSETIPKSSDISDAAILNQQEIQVSENDFSVMWTC